MRAAGTGAFWTLSAIFASLLAALASRLKTEQIDNAATHRAAMSAQSYRTARISGERGMILARDGRPLAENRKAFDLTVDPAKFKTAESLVAAIESALRTASLPGEANAAAVRRHMRVSPARPFTVLRGMTNGEVARFAEHSLELAGFDCVERYERIYPQGALAAHAIGRAGRDMPGGESETYDYADFEICGRDGLELQYDEYLRGVPGEMRIGIDSRGFAIMRETISPARKGPDLHTGLDISLQRAAEKALEGVKGAFAAIDPRDGTVMALASSPSFNPNDCTPVFRTEIYERYARDPGKPLFNRACAGAYAPGSTFKIVTALAFLGAGNSAGAEIECTGAFKVGDTKIRCARTWGHGRLDLVHAMCESCNPYFCTIGLLAGAERIEAAGRELGLGRRSGIDLPADTAGMLPTPEWKEARTGARWWDGDVAQMSIGQGQVLASPLQMAMLAGAVGSGAICTPRLNIALAVSRKPLGFPAKDLETVRRGMALVTERGSGKAAAERTAARVAGKTGTAQTGSGANLAKNVWFVGYASPENDSVRKEPLAVAIIVENGESGAETAAPRAGAILRAFYGTRTDGERTKE